jgi:hypothetical protein
VNGRTSKAPAVANGIPNNTVTNVALQLAEIDQPGGAHWENLVLHDLLA